MNIADIFNEFAQEYDKTRRQFIPCFDDFYGTAIHLIPFSNVDHFKVLDLGAGTGLLSKFILTAFPYVRLTLVDLAEKMLIQAKQRLKLYGNQLEYRVLDISKDILDFPAESYDLVMSSLAIHHLNSQEKQSLFKNIYAILKPNGLFINADQALGETPEIEVIYRQDWLNRIKKTTLTEADLSAGLERIKADKMDPLSSQLKWLKQANFRKVNCWYSNFSFCVYSGEK